MPPVRRLAALVAAALFTAAPLAAAPVPTSAAKVASPLAAARAALEEVGDYEFANRSLTDVLAEVKERTRVNVTIDPGLAILGVDPSQPVVNVQLKRAKLRDVLRASLAPYNLRVGAVADGLFVSTEEGVTARQLRQRVSVDCDGTKAADALKALAAESGANVVVDPRLKMKADAPVVLKLDDVPLETAVRLLAELADLRAVRLNNVLFVTSPERAAQLRADADGPVPPAPASPVFPNQPQPGAPGVIGIAVPGVAVPFQGNAGGPAVEVAPVQAPAPAPPISLPPETK